MVLTKRSLALGSVHDLTISAKSRLAVLMATFGETLNAEKMHREVLVGLEMSHD